MVTVNLAGLIQPHNAMELLVQDPFVQRIPRLREMVDVHLVGTTGSWSRSVVLMLSVLILEMLLWLMEVVKPVQSIRENCQGLDAAQVSANKIKRFFL